MVNRILYIFTLSQTKTFFNKLKKASKIFPHGEMVSLFTTVLMFRVPIITLLTFFFLKFSSISWAFSSFNLSFSEVDEIEEVSIESDKSEESSEQKE